MGPDPIIQGILSFAIIYLLYITVNCPCNKLLSCHLSETKLAITIILAIILYENCIKV